MPGVKLTRWMQVFSPLPLEHAAARERSGEDELEARFAEVYQAQFEYVWETARRLGVRLEEADDVVQETFLVVHRLLATYEHRGTMRGWLFAIVYRVVQRHKRTLRRWFAGWDSKASVETVAQSSALGPDRAAEAEQEARVLEAIMEKLSPEQRAVLVLAELEERPLTEVAEILGINVYTARSRLRLARDHVESSLARLSARDRWRLK